MKRFGITQRVEHIVASSERRDCLDQRWSLLVQRLGYFPVPLANIQPDKVHHYIDSLKIDALLLTGGNSVASLDPLAEDAAPERDAFESALIGEALGLNIPTIGVCRGMQMINVYMGGGLSPITGHVAVRHAISPVEDNYTLPKITNSFHNWCIGPTDLATQLSPLAVDCDGNIEAFRHAEKNLVGVMWHPEREQPFSDLDLGLIKSFL